MARAAAPASRSLSQNARIELELPVDLNAEQRIAVELVARWRMLDHDLREIGVQLLGEDHGDRSVNALAHLGLRDHQRGLAGIVDADEGIRRELAVGMIGRLLRLVDGRCA